MNMRPLKKPQKAMIYVAIIQSKTRVREKAPPYHKAFLFSGISIIFL